MEENEIILAIASGDFQNMENALNCILSKESISDELVNHILKIQDENLFVGDFLAKYESFTIRQLDIVKPYILDHIYDKDNLFASSLIDCANFNNIEGLFAICIEFIKKKREDMIVLSSLDYLFEHLNFHEINQIIRVFNRILNNKRYYQNCQTVSSFFLFRLTMDIKYFDFLKSLVLEGGKINHIVLKNMLNGMDYNKKKYFFHHDQMMEWIIQREKLEKSV